MEEPGGLVRMRDRVMKKGNYGVGAAEAVIAALQQAAVGFADGVHNFGHALAYDNQQNSIAMHDTPTGEKRPRVDDAAETAGRLSLWERARNRLNNRFGETRLSYGLIAIPAVGAVALAGANTVRRVMGDDGHEGFGLMDAAHVGATGSAFLLAAGIVASAVGMQQKVKRTGRESTSLARHVKGYRDHGLADAFVSGAATAEAIVHSTLGTTASIVVNGLVAVLACAQAYWFWPSKKNIQKRFGKHDDNHGHESSHVHEHHHEHGESCEHAHFIPPEALQKTSDFLRRSTAVGRTALSQVAGAAASKGRDWQQARQDKRQVEKRERQSGQPSCWRRAVAAGAAALTLALGVSGETGSDPVEAQPALPPVEQAEPPLQPVYPPSKPSTPEVFASTCTPIEHGGSQWRAVEQRLEDLTGQRPSTALVNAATLSAANKNLDKHPDPHTISPGDCITLPSDWALRVMAQAQPHSGLGQTMDRLNQFADWDQAMSATPIFDQLEKELAKVAG